jgi:hypothetical protein
MAKNEMPLGSTAIIGEGPRRSQCVPNLTTESQINDHGK